MAVRSFLVFLTAALGCILGAAQTPCGPGWGGSIGVPGLDDIPNALCVFDDGTGPALFAAGAFTFAGGISSPGFAKWSGTAWSPVSGATSPHNGQPRALAVFDD